MDATHSLCIRPDVAEAIKQKRPIVALESTLIVHGLPWPLNLETAQAAEAAVRREGAVAATIGVWEGVPTIGLDEMQLTRLARERSIRVVLPLRFSVPWRNVRLDNSTMIGMASWCAVWNVRKKWEALCRACRESGMSGNNFTTRE